MKNATFSTKYHDIRERSQEEEQPLVREFYRMEISETRDFVTGLVKKNRRSLLSHTERQASPLHDVSLVEAR